MYRAQMRTFSTICLRRSNIAKQTKINQNDHLFTFQKTRIFKICQLYKQNWIAWIRTTWAVPEGSRSTICRRRSKIAKQPEINQNYNLFTSQNTRIFKKCQLYYQIWTAWIRTTWAVPEGSVAASVAPAPDEHAALATHALHAALATHALRHSSCGRCAVERRTSSECSLRIGNRGDQRRHQEDVPA